MSRDPTMPLRDPIGDWADSAACKGMETELWFPVRYEHGGESALKVCATCPVKDECAEYAIPEAGLHGIWGGMNQKERERVRSRRRRGLRVAVEPVKPWRDREVLSLTQQAARAAFGHT